MTARVQSVDRVFAVLECLADGGGSLCLSELAARTSLPMPTIHRLVRSLVTSGCLPDADVRALLHRTGMPARTPHTLTTPESMQDALDAVRCEGFAVDDSEQELGVRSVAVPVRGLPFRAAIAISGPASRVAPDGVPAIASDLQAVADQLRTAFGN